MKNPLSWVLPGVLTEMAERRPDSMWVIDDSGDTLTFGAAQTRARRAASFFSDLGVRHGQRVGMLMFNGCDFIAAWMGLGKAGAIAVMVNTELRGDFLKHQLNDSEVSCLIISAALVPVLEAISSQLPHLKTIVTVGSSSVDWGRGIRSVDWRRYDGMPEWDGLAPAASDTACIMYTSGTSGPSKGVLMPHAHCALYGIGTIKSMQLGHDDRYYICLPLFHANGLLMQLAATLLAGIPAFVRTRFSASNWLSDIRTHGSTVTNLLGTTAAFVVAQAPSRHDRDHHLRAMLNAPNLPSHEEQFRSRFGVQDVVSGFGMTEVNIPIWGRVGSPIPGKAGWVHEEHFEVCIADAETDLPLPAGQVGEILVRPRVPFGFMAGYYNAPHKTVEAWRNLWFHTGDAGVIDEAGVVTFIDRLRDCIRRRGENISATEVEAVVGELPGVAEVAAYAVPSDIPGGEDEVMLALVPLAGTALDCANVVHEASARLPRFARPRFVKIVERLPKTATGKIQRALLKKQGIVDALDLAPSRA
jgi:crotonobetaine/carnitine-CoA ligase